MEPVEICLETFAACGYENNVRRFRGGYANVTPGP